jgi:hypothetical protein
MSRPCFNGKQDATDMPQTKDHSWPQRPIKRGSRRLQADLEHGLPLGLFGSNETPVRPRLVPEGGRCAAGMAILRPGDLTALKSANMGRLRNPH